MKYKMLFYKWLRKVRIVFIIFLDQRKCAQADSTWPLGAFSELEQENRSQLPPDFFAQFVLCMRVYHFGQEEGRAETQRRRDRNGQDQRVKAWWVSVLPGGGL